jgi:hypothetical protein
MPANPSTELKENTNQYLFFRILYDVADFVTWAYYVILLLRASDNSISLVFVNHAIVYAGLLIGYVVGSALLSRVGYLGNYRIANLLLLLSCILTVITLPHILEVHAVLALIRGVGRAFFLVAHHMFYMHEIHGTNRSRLLNLVVSINYIFGIAFPFIVGGAISTYGYEWIFLVGIGLYLFGTFIPWKYNKVPRNQFNLSELKDVTRRRGFKRWSGLVLTSEFTNSLKLQCLAVIPFLLLGSEFEVGLLASGLAIVAAVMTFAHRNDKFRVKIQLGYFGGLVIGISNLILGAFWSIPALVIRGLGINAGNAFYSPAIDELNYKNRESVLSNFLEQTTIEINLYVEVLLFISRVAASLVLMVALFVFEIDSFALLQGFILISAFSELLVLWLNILVNKVLRRSGQNESTYHSPLVSAPSVVHKI